MKFFAQIGIRPLEGGLSFGLPDTARHVVQSLLLGLFLALAVFALTRDPGGKERPVGTDQKNFKGRLVPALITFAGTSALAAFTAWGEGPLFLCLMFALLLSASVQDLRTHTMPDFYWGMVLCLALPAAAQRGLWFCLGGGLCVLLPQLLLLLLPEKLRPKIHGADLKMTSALGVCLGPFWGLACLTAAQILPLCFYGAGILLGRYDRHRAFAQIPFVAAAGMICGTLSLLPAMG